MKPECGQSNTAMWFSCVFTPRDLVEVAMIVGKDCANIPLSDDSVFQPEAIFQKDMGTSE